MKSSLVAQNITLLVLLLIVVAFNFFLLYNPSEVIFNQIFTPCENGFTYSKSLGRCDCVDPFFGDFCEKHRCTNGGKPTLGDYGWACQCTNFWFGEHCDLCGTYDGVNGTCFGDIPYPSGALCRADEYSFGEVDFVGPTCSNVCVKVKNARKIEAEAFEVYSFLQEKAPDKVVGCPENSCYDCDAITGDAQCVDGYLKSLNSRECDLNCGPCDNEACNPCSRRGECVLRGSPICVCDPKSRGSGCELLCPGVTEVFNGIVPTLTGSECFANGVCNDFAVCECFQDVEGTDRFIDNCKYECPLNDGVVCSGHGACGLSNEGAVCECDAGFTGPSCQCSDGTVEEATCKNGQCNAEGTCDCFGNEAQGFWTGTYCNQCEVNYFTEATGCTQYCNPETTCSSHATTCSVSETIFDANGLVVPCSFNPLTNALEGTCARCDCDSNFLTQYLAQPLFNEFVDMKSIAYSCTDCQSSWYPKADTQAFDSDICTRECSLETCNGRGVCMRDSGQCACYGSCPSNATLYDGECFMKSTGMQPHFNPLSNCEECSSNWGPNLDVWSASCNFFCNVDASAEDSLPAECYDDGKIINECVFCSGRASNCSALTGQPSCNCEGDYTGRYCQNSCGSCNNGVCEENKLYNYFLLDVPEYEKQDASSFQCECEGVDVEDRLTFEKEMFSLVTYELSRERSYLDLPPQKNYYGEFCTSACKRGSDGSFCNSYGDCKSVEVVGLSGVRNCATDSDCNVDPSNPFVEDSSYFCNIPKVPGFFKQVEDVQAFQFCSAEEQTFIHEYIDKNNWNEFCYNVISSTVPQEMYHSHCKDCDKLVNDKSFWNQVDQKCTAFLADANQETFIDAVRGCGDCAYEVANFDWETWCELPGDAFEGTCSEACQESFKNVDWVQNNGFCSVLDTYTKNTYFQNHVCSAYDNNQVCELVGQQENSYDSATACFTPREAVFDTFSNKELANPYSGSLRSINCKSITENTPEVCSTTTKLISNIKSACDTAVLNVLNTGLNECELRDQEYNYCLLKHGNAWLSNATECRLTLPKCLSCGTGNSLYEAGVAFDLTDESSATYNPDPAACCRPNDILVRQAGGNFQCRPLDTYDTTCRYQQCKSAVESIDWQSKLSALDAAKSLDGAPIASLSITSTKRSIELGSFCSTRRSLDDSIRNTVGINNFYDYCNYILNNPVGTIALQEGSLVLTESQQLTLNSVKSAWWEQNIGDVIIGDFDMNLYYTSGNNVEVSESSTFAAPANQNFLHFHVWIYIEEVNNDFVFSVSLIGSNNRLLLQVDLRSKTLYVNNEATTLYEDSLGWHRLEVHGDDFAPRYDVIWQGSALEEQLLLNITTPCFDCDRYNINSVTVENLGMHNIILHDLRLLEGSYDLATSYFAFALTDNAVSSLGAAQCTAFQDYPPLESNICPDNSCTATLKNVNWGSVCSSYLFATELTDTEKTNLCNDDNACLQRIESWDKDTYFREYTFNDRPQETRVEACLTPACDALLESYDYVDLCESNLRTVRQSCSACTVAFDSFLSTFNKVAFCDNLETKKQEVADLFTTELATCSSNCLSHLEDVNYYTFCNERKVHHGPFTPYSLSFNLSTACREELFSFNTDTFSTLDDCLNLGKNGAVSQGKCKKLFCDCTDPNVGGERCNIQCSVGSDGSACNTKSGLGTCCLQTTDELTLSTCITDIVDDDTSVFNGECLCFSAGGASLVGGANCDALCDKCSVAHGSCEGSGGCLCKSPPYEETVLSNFYHTESVIVDEMQLPFDWANKEEEGLELGSINVQEPLYLLYTTEESCEKSELDKCCTWSTFQNSQSNPLHENYNGNVLSKRSDVVEDAYECVGDISTCVHAAVNEANHVVRIHNEYYDIVNPTPAWPIKYDVQLTANARLQEPGNTQNPATESITSFRDSLCPSYRLIDGYYRVKVQKEPYEVFTVCYNASKTVNEDAGKSIVDVHMLCQQADDCLGYWLYQDQAYRVSTVPVTGSSCATVPFYKKAAFTPVPVATSLDVFYKNQWCRVTKVNGDSIGIRSAGFISAIDCTRVVQETASEFNTCKLPFIANIKDQFGNVQTTKISSCTDENIYLADGTLVFDFKSLQTEITRETGILNPTYCPSKEWFQNITYFLEEGDQGYCKQNNDTYKKCTASVIDAENCVCGELRCNVNEYCYVKSVGQTTLHECHACSDKLGPTPEVCCPQGQYLVDGVCQSACDEHWVCAYNEVAQAGPDTYTFDGIEFAKHTGPHPELLCSQQCYDPFTTSCVDCDVCKSNIKKNPIEILQDTKIGGYHFLKSDGSYSFNSADANIDFLRLCQDTSNEVDNSAYALSVKSKKIHDDIQFLLTDRSASSNPSSRCGDSCHDVCPATDNGVPCSGRGICNKDCSCSCFTLDDNEKYLLTNVDGLGLKEVPDFGIGSAMAFKSPYRGDDCSETCPGFEEGMFGKNPLSAADKSFIMEELICSGHGECLTSNAGVPQCQCETGYVNGRLMNCEFKCPGNECSGHGECSVTLQGTAEIYVPNLFLQTTASITESVMQKVFETYPDKSTYYQEVYYALPEAVKATEDAHFSTVRFLSQCPSSHPYVYNNGKHCCSFSTVANGTTLNKRSNVNDCFENNRIACPTNQYFVDKDGSTVEQRLKQRLGSDYVGNQFIDPTKPMQKSKVCLSSILTLEEEALCEEEARLILNNQFTENPDHYTCDPSIAMTSMRRNQRPYYDPLSVLQLGAGQTENVMYSYEDVMCSNIVAAERNLNGFLLSEQPQPITLLECASCSCQQDAKSGFWDGTTCSDCKFGFFGESCSGMCPAVCGTINVGATTLFYEEYQRRIGSTLPCEEPVNEDSAFYFECPLEAELQSILNVQGVTWEDSYQRASYCNDGRFSGGSCLRCNAPLVGSLDTRLEEPRQSCFRLECPSNLDFFQRVNRLPDKFGINLDLSVFYSNIAFQLIGKDFGNAYTTEGGTGLSFYKPIDLYEPCNAGATVSEKHYCCNNADLTVDYSLVALKGLFASRTDAMPLSVQECAEKALSADVYTVANIAVGTYHELSKGLFAHDGQCYVFTGFLNLYMDFLLKLNSIDTAVFLQNFDASFTETDSVQVYRGFHTCPNPTSRNLAIWSGSTVDPLTTSTISSTYEVGCSFENDYPSYVAEANDDREDGKLIGSSIDPYLSNGDAILDVLDILNRDKCIEMFFNYCASGHDDNIQNPFLTYYSFMKVEEEIARRFPDGSDQSGRCNLNLLKSKMWCPQCPRCRYNGTVPGNDLQLQENSRCDFGYFPYCKSKEVCSSSNWKTNEDCELGVPQIAFNLVDSVQQTVTFNAYTRSLLGTYSVEDCATVADAANTYQGYFVFENCGEVLCACYKVDSVTDTTLNGNPSTFLYQVDYTSNNGINVFEQYIEHFVGSQSVSSTSLLGLFVERMRQSIPDKYRHFEIPAKASSALIDHYDQWLECACVEDPNDLDHCATFDVTQCVKFNPLQMEWELLWFTRGSVREPYELPSKEVSADEFHDEAGHGAVLRTAATLKSTVDVTVNEIPDTCTEAPFDTLENIPSTKTYTASDVECGKETVCTCPAGGTAGMINYESAVVVDSLGRTLHHAECMVQVGYANSHTLNSCQEEALKRFNFYDGNYVGSKGLFAVERPQITDAQLFSSSSYTNYDFESSSELTCYVYTNVDQNILFSSNWNILNTATSICLDFPNEQRGCARSKHLYENLLTKAIIGNTNLYTNQCDEPTFIQTYKSPHISRSGNVFSKVSPYYENELACYDYGPCIGLDANGLTNTTFCSCRPSVFTQSFPGMHYKNFNDVALHNEGESAWDVVGETFQTSFSFWTKVRDKVAGEGDGSFTETAFQTYKDDILNLCYDDGVLDDSEVVRLSNRELPKNQYTQYHLLFKDVVCPSFATLHQSINHRTRGRFAADVWTSSNPKNMAGELFKGSGHTMLQKIHVKALGDMNYIFNKAIFMIDYRQINVSKFYFGDPNYGTPLKGVFTMPLPYESVLKSYCDSGEQPYKRFGPCVNLKNSRINGKLYIKHFGENEFRLKELPLVASTLDVSVEGDTLLEHDTVLLVVKDSKFYAVSNFDAVSVTHLSKTDFSLYTKTYNAKAATRELMFDENHPNFYHTCSAHGVLIDPLQAEPVQEEYDAFLFLRPQNEDIVKQGLCQPQQSVDAGDSWGNLPVCEESVYAQLTGVSYGPTCSCPSGFANMRYVDYNQPFSFHGGCTSIKGDTKGAFIDYKSCSGVGSCSIYSDTPYCCGYDSNNCNAITLKGVCVADNGLPALDTALRDFCNRPYAGCSTRQRNGLSLDDSLTECGGQNALQDTFNGMTKEWVRPQKSMFTNRTLNYPSSADDGVVYVDGKPYDTMRSNYAIYTSGCYACTDGRYNSEAGKAECRGCDAGTYSISRTNPYTLPPVDENGKLLADRGNQVYEYEWWKVNGYPPAGNEWHEVNEWLVKKPLEPYFQGSDGAWVYNPNVALDAVVDMQWKKDDFSLSCNECPDNFASIPLAEDNYESGDLELGYGGFASISTRAVTNNRQCLVCPPGYDTGTADHLRVGISKSPLEECPSAYPFAFTTKEFSPFYGSYCCKTDERRIDAYYFHAKPEDACFDFIRCNSIVDYATDGFYCVDSTKKVYSNNMILRIENGVGRETCVYYSATDSTVLTTEATPDPNPIPPTIDDTTTSAPAPEANPPIELVFGNAGSTDYVYNSENDPTIALCVNQEYTLTRSTTGHALHVVASADCVGCSTGSYSSYTNSLLRVAGSSSESYTFTGVGDYYYLCELHPSMVGLIQVSSCSRRRRLLSHETTVVKSESSICSTRAKSSVETLSITADALTDIRLTYTVNGIKSELLVRLSKMSAYIKEGILDDIQIEVIRENYNILLDEDVSCNGVFASNTYDVIFFDYTFDHGDAQKISLGAADNPEDCAIKAIDYHGRHKTQIDEPYFSLETDECFTFVGDACENGCISQDIVGRAMKINKEGTNRTGASCFLQSVLDVKKKSPYCRKCPQGKFNSRAGSNCLPCPIGHYQDEEGKTSCKICENSKYQFLTGSKSCLDCPLGSENLKDNNLQCQLCSAGKYSDDSSGCKTCPAGKSINNNFASFQAKTMQITNIDATVAMGPLVNYDNRFDYTEVNGIAEIDVFGNYVTGFSPFFEGLQESQLLNHDSAEDCTSCSDGFYALPGFEECVPCEAGKVANDDNSACNFCYGVTKFARTTFVRTGAFVCSPLEKLGEADADEGILVEKDYHYVEETQKNLATFIEMATEEIAQDYCKSHYQCSGYSKTIMRDDSIRWRVPKTVEEPSLLGKSYVTHGHTTMPYYMYEESKSVCDAQHVCIGYVQENEKTYNVLPLKEEEEKVYTGTVFTSEKLAAIDCASREDCEGISAIQEITEIIDSELSTITSFVAEKTIITLPDQNYGFTNEGTYDVVSISCRQYSVEHEYIYWELKDGLCYLSKTI